VLYVLEPQCHGIGDLDLPKAYFCKMGEAFGIHVSILVSQGWMSLLEVEVWRVQEKLSL
jgi:hypothetical protein